MLHPCPAKPTHPMKILFAGTPEFSVPSLEACVQSPHSVVAVLTQPDRPAGRGRRMIPGPVKQFALQHGMRVLQPETLRSNEAETLLRGLQVDVMVVVAYGLILPASILAIPRLGAINVHASLLPRWRGAAPIQRAVLAGDEETGVTIMQVEPKLDAGPTFLKRARPIAPGQTAGELHDALSTLGAEALLEVLVQLENGTALSEPQDEDLVTYADKLSKDEAQLDWTRPAVELERQIRAFNPWPVAECFLDNQILRVWRAEALTERSDLAPGTVLPGRRTWDMATGEGLLRFLEVQLPGRRRVSAQDFLNAQLVPSHMGVRAAG